MGLLSVLEEAITVFSSASNQHAFQEFVNGLRYHVAKVYQKEVSQKDDEEEGRSPYEKAAIHLSKINLERDESGKSNQDKVKIWLDCARLYLVDELYREAETFVNKCAGLMNTKPMKDTYKLRFWSCLASCQDYNQKYHQAATQYYRLAEKILDEETSLDKLARGIKCIVLSPAGPNRDRLLTKYYRDERASRLSGFSFLEALYIGRFVTNKEVEEFQQTLAEHQNRKTKEGWTLLEKATIEHNLIAAAKVYNSILLEDLGHVLGVTVQKAEEIAANMIAEGRLQGLIDQNNSLLHFSVNDSVLPQWDTHIDIACNSVNAVVDRLSSLHPAWMAKQYK